VHIDDAMSLLRMDEPEISEIAVRLRSVDRLASAASHIGASLDQSQSAGALRPFEVHTWEALSPFYNVVVLMDVLVISAMVGLVAIVLISVMNVMLMSVYERVKEIGTIAAMGTMPGTILSMFVLEGLALGALGILIGNAVATAAILQMGALAPDNSRMSFVYDDDSGGNLDPRLDFTTEFDGNLVLSVGSFDGSFGCYWVKVEVTVP